MATAGPGTPGKVSLPVDNDLEDLLLWRDPVKSGGVLLSCTVLYVLLEWTRWSLISLISTVALFVIITSFLWATLANALNRPGPPVPALLREGVSESQVKSYVEQVTPIVNKGLALGYRLATGKDAFLTAQVALGLYIISKIGRAFTVVGWLYTVVLLSFTVPKIYELNKHEIDNAAHTGYKKTKELYDQHVTPVVSRIPRASNASSLQPVKQDLAATTDKFNAALNAAVQEPKKAM